MEMIERDSDVSDFSDEDDTDYLPPVHPRQMEDGGASDEEDETVPPPLPPSDPTPSPSINNDTPVLRSQRSLPSSTGRTSQSPVSSVTPPSDLTPTNSSQTQARRLIWYKGDFTGGIAVEPLDFRALQV